MPVGGGAAPVMHPGLGRTSIYTSLIVHKVSRSAQEWWAEGERKRGRGGGERKRGIAGGRRARPQEELDRVPDATEAIAFELAHCST
eukprot:224730-Chlamydomonas_euryale.AAC.1